MLNKLLNYLGLIQKNKITDVELSKLIVDKWGEDLDSSIDKKTEDAIFVKVSEVDGFNEYLRQTITKDIKRYFSALPAQQQEVRGALMRTAYIRSKIIEASNPKKGKISGLRYGL